MATIVIYLFSSFSGLISPVNKPDYVEFCFSR